jgi:hypothetical protein
MIKKLWNKYHEYPLAERLLILFIGFSVVFIIEAMICIGIQERCRPVGAYGSDNAYINRINDAFYFKDLEIERLEAENQLLRKELDNEAE